MITRVRQGDVLVSRVPQLPVEVSAVPAERLILAHGEVTGHAHEVVAAPGDTLNLPPAQLFDAPDGTRFLLVDRPCALTHQEHGTIALAPGAYHITRQREYSPEAIRQVAD